MKKRITSFSLIIACIFTYLFLLPASYNAEASDNTIPYIILSQYYGTMDINDQAYLIAFTSTGKKPSFKSSNSRVASVNTYGLITAKKSGTVMITARIKDAESSCRITVNKTNIYLNTTFVSMEHNGTFRLSANTSNGSKVRWKSNRKSIATIDDSGAITGGKPGDAIITASADGTSVTCKVKVRKPVITLNPSSISLYRNNKAHLSISVSSGISPKWKSNKSSVAAVDQSGNITAIKHGTAIITATVDGVKKTCKVTIKKPDITLSAANITLPCGKSKKLNAYVSSGNPPDWKSSNTNNVTISRDGVIKAIKKGKAIITVTEDGTKVKCKVNVTDK